MSTSKKPGPDTQLRSITTKDCVQIHEMVECIHDHKIVSKAVCILVSHILLDSGCHPDVGTFLD
jgi:hypothetical protein